LHPDLEHALRTALEGRRGNLVLVGTVDSTHAVARRLIEQVDTEGVPLHPTVVVAERQSSGCGRGDRHWESPPGGLYLSWLSADVESDVVPLLPMLAAAAAHRALTDIGLTAARIKWPNDLLVDGCKIAGLLVHARHGERILVTVGLGVNIAAAPALPEDRAAPRPVAVADLLGPGPTAQRAASIAATYLEHLETSCSDAAPAVDHWRRHLVHAPGDRVRVRLSGAEVLDGRFAGVDDAGHIRIEVEGDERTLTGGDIIETDGA
jgi:BirA family biotin operon repressor/biotin-[acetyl-CoA-carboxylase] ligase